MESSGEMEVEEQTLYLSILESTPRQVRITTKGKCTSYKGIICGVPLGLCRNCSIACRGRE